MNVLAFLQNQWFNEPDEVRAMIARHNGDPERQHRLRRRLIHYALFAGCLTGRRLKAALGEDWCRKIIWEEGSKEIGGKASSFFPPNLPHILSSIESEKPDVVVLFGKANSELCRDIFRGSSHLFLVLCAPHPAARGAATVPALKVLADKLNQLK